MSLVNIVYEKKKVINRNRQYQFIQLALNTKRQRITIKASNKAKTEVVSCFSADGGNNIDSNTTTEAAPEMFY